MEKKTETIKELELRIRLLELEIEKLKLEGKPPAYIPYLPPSPMPTPPEKTPYPSYPWGSPVIWC